MPVGTGDWDTPANWQDIGDGQNIPSAEFNEIGVIGIGGTAQVATEPISPGGVQINNNGAVEILATGALTVTPGPGNLAQGVVDINSGGTLSVAPGGFLSAHAFTSNGVVRVIGATASLNVTNSMTLEGGGTLIAEILASSHSTISVSGDAILDGAFVADFTGHIPSINETWDLITAPTIGGNFDSIAAVGIGPLPLGQVFAVRTVAGGAQGKVARLSIERQLVLTVDRDTKALSIHNPHGVPIPMDSYAIQSSIGSLNGNAWNSLQTQGFDGNAWFETGNGGTANRLAELTMDGETFFPAASSTPLGSVYAPHFTAFGVETEDYTFTYSTLSGEIVEGQIHYTGDKQYNNLVLTVDSSGAAQIRNESPFSVSIEGYVILSPSGSLLSDDGDWLSLEDQGAEGGAWFEANVGPTQIAELRDDGATFLGMNQGYHLGTLFNTDSDQDLIFRFLLDGQALPMTGVVVYGALPPVEEPGQVLAGDYNNDGVVNASDYVVWRDHLGSPATLPNDTTPGVTAADYEVWRGNFGAIGPGSGSGGVGTAVPEPSVPILLLATVFSVLSLRRFGGSIAIRRTSLEYKTVEVGAHSACCGGRTSRSHFYWRSLMKAVHWFALGIAVLLFGSTSVVSSAPITWSSGDFDDDSDVRNDGSTIFAYYFNGTPANNSASGTSPLSGPMTVNGVDWQSVFVSTNAMTNQFPQPGFTMSPTITAATFGHTVATSGFGALIAGVAFRAGPIDVTLTDLTVGRTYLLQWLYHHAAVQGRTTTLNDRIDGTLGNTVTLVNQGITITEEPLLPNDVLTSGSWTDGEFATGAFVADATTQSFRVTASAGSVLVSGMQLRLLPVPEPSTFVLLLAMGGCLLPFRRGGASSHQ